MIKKHYPEVVKIPQLADNLGGAFQKIVLVFCRRPCHSDSVENIKYVRPMMLWHSLRYLFFTYILLHNVLNGLHRLLYTPMRG
jgi:hypothetical protein